MVITHLPQRKYFTLPEQNCTLLNSIILTIKLLETILNNPILYPIGYTF